MIKKNKPIDAFGIGRVSNEKSKSTSNSGANGTKNISVPSDLTPFDIFMR